MANRYWRGGTGSWTTTSTTNWSTTSGGAAGASVPTVADNVIFDQAATYTVTMTGALNCLSITVSAGTVTFTSTGTLNVRASMSLVAATVWSATGTITFSSTTTGQTITTNGVTINGAITFAGVGGGWSLGSTLTTGVIRTVTLTNGAITLNGFDIICGIFNSNNSNARSIAFGTNNISLVHTTAATTVLNCTTLTNFTYTGTGGFISIMSVTRTFVSGGTTANAVNLTLTSGASIPTFTTASVFNTLNFSASAATVPLTSISVNNLVLNASGVYTSMTVIFIGTGTINTNGNTTLVTVSFAPLAAKTLTLASNVTLAGASNFTLTGVAGGASLVLGGFTLQVGNFISNNGLARSIAFGATNIVLAHTTAGQVVMNMSNITNFTWSGTGRFVSTMSVTRTFTCGTTGGTINTAPNLTLISGSSIASLTTNSWFNTLDFGTTSYTSGIFTINVMSLIANNSTSNIAALIINAVGGGVLYTNSTGIGALNIITGVTALQSGVTTNCTTCTITTGTLVIPAGTTLACSSTFTSSSSATVGKLQSYGTITCTTFNITGAFTMTSETSGTITPSVSFAITSGTFNYFGGTITSLNTFTHQGGTAIFYSNFSLTTNGTYTFRSGTLTLRDGVTLTTGIFTDGVNSFTRVLNFGTSIPGNIHLTHTTPGTQVLAYYTGPGLQTMTGPGGFTVADMSNTRSFRTGDNCGYPRLTFTTGASVATLVSQIYLSTLDFGTTTFTLPAVTVNLRGSALGVTGFDSGYLTLADGNYSAMTLNVETDNKYKNTVINTNNKTIALATFRSSENTVIRVNQSLTTTGAMSNFNGGIVYFTNNLICESFNKSGVGTANGSWIGIGTTNKLIITGASFNNNGAAGAIGSYFNFTIDMTSASTKTFIGNNGVYPTLNQGGAGILNVTGSNFFDNITNSVAPCEITFPPSTLQTVKAFNVNGNAGNIVSLTISSGTVSGPSISKPSGIVSIDYVNINRLFSTGGATWYAGANSSWISMPSPAEWIFTAPPAPGAFTVSIGEITVVNGGFKISNDAV